MRSCAVDAHKKSCNCSYEPCPRKGICLPTCLFPDAVERTYDRSVDRFIRTQGGK